MQSTNKNKLILAIETKQAVLDFINAGGKITVCGTRKAKGSKTFRNDKGSAFNLGAKRVNLKGFGFAKAN